MRTFAQLLRIGFWMLPIQRALTVLGAALCCLGLQRVLPLAMPVSNLPIVFLGFALLMFVPVTCGGAFLRMLSSRRTMLLLPHAKGRLLSGAIGITLLASLLWLAICFILYLGAPPKLKPDLEFYAMQLVLTLSFATQCTIGVFIASRGPAWGLLMIIVWQLPGVLMRLAGNDDVPRLMTGPMGLAMVPIAWLAFSMWYLRTRQVSRARWGGSGPAPQSSTASFVATSREHAMLLWVLGGSTPVRLGLQWGLAACGLIAVQWVMHQLFGPDGNPRAAQAMMFGTLSVSAVAIGAVSYAIAGRSRSLWLVGCRTRHELHAWCERQMLRVVLAIALPFLLLGGSLWLLATPRLELPGAYLLLSMIAPGLAAAWLGLMQQHRRSLIDPLAGLAIVVGWYYGLAQPLYAGTTRPRWEVVAGQIALVVLLRAVAQVRWRSADWRRAQQ
ncbi:MAG: hypothetical protein ABIP38_03320 [Steroidobacteraceae bacterium]